MFVNSAAFLNWDISKLKEGPEQAWTDEYFYICWLVRRLAKAGAMVVRTLLYTHTTVNHFAGDRRRWHTFSLT